ncbi:MAG TPA: metal ABC transporter permease [Longimicrobiales bacterium]|nr:metal ABC transporter permease [Longimicrobiales bacterium]
MSITLEIQLVAIIVALACALPGVFLVLRRMALMSDAISHTVLLGIVLGFFVTHDVTSPLLILAAAGMGLLTVVLVEAIRSTRLVAEDASIGIVFPALFSVAVILIGRFAGDVHLDTDAVLLGEIAFAPFRRFEAGGLDLGPRAAWLMGAILLLNCLFLVVFYKELKLSTFDPALAAALGLSPTLLHYAFMGMVSVTAVGAFDTVGSVLVVALMIAPPAAAYLLTDRLPLVIVLSGAIAIAAAITGFWIAWWLDASIAGSMATMAGVLFALAFLLAPERGVVSRVRQRARQRVEFAQLMLTIHLLHHEGTAAAATETREDHLHHHLKWEPERARAIVDGAVESRLLRREQDGRLALTETGRRRAREGMFV